MSEIEILYNRAIKISNYLIKISSNPQYEVMKNIIENEYKKKVISRLKIINKDLNEWIKGLTLDQQNEIIFLLGEDTKNFSKEESIEIKKIIKKKKIENEDEYRLILEEVDKISQNQEPDYQKIEIYNKLLIEFDRKRIN